MKLALGTAQFGLDYGIANHAGRLSDISARQVLDLAKARGLDMLDTAIAYGESEAVLGRIGVPGWKIVSKLPPVPDDVDDVSAWAKEQVRGALQRLGAERLHAVLLHRPSQLLDRCGPALLEALGTLKQEGLTRGVGISIYKPEELDALSGMAHFDVVQAPLSIIDRRLVESGWAARLQAAGTEVHTRSAFLQGLLLMPPAARPTKFDRWAPLWRLWSQWLADHAISALEACIRYPLSIDEVDRVIIGVDGTGHLLQVVRAAEGPLPPLPACPLDDQRLLDPSLWNLL